ncbi:helix-turn-helix domain-containing protein [Fusibacter ferrireducens]|uniref:Helix-turn-helix domain-containing protein n=1 Tax=Fusibacter ferrireducens TaxID=2785058 RepID=A0ABR9ZQK1_9FIRM|nr:helix-turn-helix domain-containing protein [Fusibacter ferrireducens]MBF4692729.1 helix-turn-helix domain-containing protein [Fusibacter ferrireducens]
MDSLGEQIKKLRKEYKLSQKTLAENIGIAQSAVANYESGYRVPNHEILIKLADYFDVSVDALLCRVHEKKDWIEISDIFLKSVMKYDYPAAYALLEHMLDNDISPKEIYLKVIRYALAKIGWLWETGMMTSADEHFITRQIERIMDDVYRKVMQSMPIKTKCIKVVGMAAPHEAHTIPIKMVMQLLSFEGIETFFIGTSVPVKALSEFVVKNQIDYVILSITMQTFWDELRRYMDAVQEDAVLSQKPFVIGGRAAQKNMILSQNMAVEIVLKYEETLEVIK